MQTKSTYRLQSGNTVLKYRYSRQIVSIGLAFRQSPWRAVLIESQFCHSSRRAYWLPESSPLGSLGASDMSYTFYYPGRYACPVVKRAQKEILGVKEERKSKPLFSGLGHMWREIIVPWSFIFMNSCILERNLISPWWQCWCNSIITSQNFSTPKSHELIELFLGYEQVSCNWNAQSLSL